VERHHLRRLEQLGSTVLYSVPLTDGGVRTLQQEGSFSEEAAAHRRPQPGDAAVPVGLSAYRLAEHRLREQLAATGQTIPSQVNKPTDRPTMRWMFHCFEGISLVRFLPPPGPPQYAIAGVEPLQEQVIRLL